VKLRDMWSNTTVAQAVEALGRPDVTVTNASDKTTQLDKIAGVDQAVRIAWGEAAAAAFRGTNVLVERLPLGFSLRALTSEGAYSQAAVKEGWLKWLTSSDSAMRQDAREWLAVCEASERYLIEQLELWTSAFTDEMLSAADKLKDSTIGPKVAIAAMETLGQLEPAALANHAGKLLAKLEDTDSDVRWMAVATLRKLDAAGIAQHVESAAFTSRGLWLELGHPNADVRWAALEMLAKLPAAKQAQLAATVAPKLENKNEGVRCAALEVFGKIAKTTAEKGFATYDANLAARLSDTSTAARLAAVEILGECDAAIVSKHAAAVTAMLQNDSSWYVRAAALETLGQLDAVNLANHATAIVAKLTDANTTVCVVALETLGKLDTNTLDAHGAAIQKATEHSDEVVRAAAVRLQEQCGNRDRTVPF